MTRPSTDPGATSAIARSSTLPVRTSVEANPMSGPRSESAVTIRTTLPGATPSTVNTPPGSETVQMLVRGSEGAPYSIVMSRTDAPEGHEMRPDTENRLAGTSQMSMPSASMPSTTVTRAPGSVTGTPG